MFYWVNEFLKKQIIEQGDANRIVDFLINDGVLPHNLPSELTLFCKTSIHFYRGQLDQFLTESETLNFENAPLKSELQFLIGAAFARQGGLDKSEPYWQNATLFSSSEQTTLICDRIVIERCMFDLNRGLKKRAATKFLQLKWQHLPDSFYVTRAYAGLVICLIDLGRFDEAEHFLALEFRYIQNLQSRLFLQGYERLRVLLDLLTERHEQAFERLQSALIHLPQSSLSKAYLLEMLFEAHIGDGSEKEAINAYRQVRQLRQEIGLHKQYYSSLEHRVEVDLLRKNPRALKFAKRIVKACKSRGDFYSLAKGFIYLGRAQHAFHIENSKRSFERALALCEKHNYEVVELDCLQHMCGALWQQGDKESFQQSLQRLETKSLENGWHVLNAAATLVRAWHEGRPVRYSSFLEMLMRSRWPLLARRYLEKYDFLSDFQLAINKGGGASPQVLSETDFRHKTIYEHTYLWFKDEHKILFMRHRHLKVFDLQSLGSKLGALAETLLQSVKPMSVSQIHKLYSNIPYHPLKHGPAIHSLLARLRVFLSELKLKLVFENESYLVIRPSAWASVECLQKSGHRIRELSKRQMVLEMLSQRSVVPTSALCKSLGIKRQTLHPLLKHLENEGLISMVAAGPQTGYRKN